MPLSTSQRSEGRIYQTHRRSRRPNLTEAKAKKLARTLINDHALSTSAVSVVDTLSIAGALTTLQLQRMTGVSLRTLQRLHYDPPTNIGHFVDYAWASDKLIKVGFEKSKSLKSLRVWKLGVLGTAVAVERGLLPVTYESSYRMKQITHDVCCAEIALRLFLHGERSGWVGEWWNKNEARVTAIKQTKSEDGQKGLEPDAMLQFERDRKSMQFCIEFHNEIGRRKVKEKIERYQEFKGAQRFSEWGLKKMPYLLVGYRHKSILAAYTEELHKRPELNAICIFVEQMGEWVNGDGLPKLSIYKNGILSSLPDIFA